MKIPLAKIEFFNGVPTLRGIGPLVQDKDAELHYDTTLQLVGVERRGVPVGKLEPLFYCHPSGVAMTPFPEGHERWKGNSDVRQEGTAPAPARKGEGRDARQTG